VVRRPLDRRSQSGVPGLAIMVVLFVFTFALMVYAFVSWKTCLTKIYAGYQRDSSSPSRYEKIEQEGTDFKGYITLLEDKDNELRAAKGEIEKLNDTIGIEYLDRFEDKLASLKAKLEQMYKNDADDDNLVVLIRRLQQHADSLEDQLRVAKDEKKKSDAALQEARGQIQTEGEQYKARAETFQTELTKKNQEFNEVRASLESKISELQSRIFDINSQSEKEREKSRKQLVVVTRDLDRVKQALDEVQSKKVGGPDFDKDSAEPGGVVLHVDKAGAACMVDIGQKHGAKVGLQFVVYETGPGGKRIEKGTIELKKIYPDFSYAGILSVKDELNPMLRDDVVISPIFKRGAPNIFVLESDIDRIEKSVLKQKIEKFGNKVVDNVTAETDFVVIKENPGQMAQEARNWGVRVIRVSDITKVLGDN